MPFKHLGQATFSLLSNNNLVKKVKVITVNIFVMIQECLTLIRYLEKYEYLTQPLGHKIFFYFFV